MREPRPTPADWLLGIGLLYVPAVLLVSFFLVAVCGFPLSAVVESHLGLVLLQRLGWMGWAWFLVPYGIAGLLLALAGRRRLPFLVGLCVAAWVVEGAWLLLCEAALGV